MDYLNIRFLYPGQWIVDWVCKDGESIPKSTAIRVKGLGVAMKTLRPFNDIPIEKTLELFGVSTIGCKFDVYTSKGIMDVDTSLGSFDDIAVEKGCWLIDDVHLPIKGALIIMNRPTH